MFHHDTSFITKIIKLNVNNAHTHALYLTHTQNVHFTKRKYFSGHFDQIQPGCGK